ncbi:methyltransferase domain-containing protein, partial [Geobacillus sp. MMMUD3]|nr:methyltransferase domain-containing protein [Geobacillus sp. MMMUD3]
FRPDYRRIGHILSELPGDTPVLATTATANSRVVTDVAEQLGDDTTVVRGELARDSLRLGVQPGLDPSARIAWLASHLGDFTGSGIVYTLTVSAAEDITRILRDQGHEVRAYTGRTDAEERAELEQMLKDNRLKALIATSALGMGFDKPDLGFVVHVGAPSSAVAYYQQVGRAGRATESADVLLLPGAEDTEIWEYFATASMPSQSDANAVLTALAEASASPDAVPALARPASVLDLGAGNGWLLTAAIAVTGADTGVGVDVSKAAVAWARETAEANGTAVDIILADASGADAGDTDSGGTDDPLGGAYDLILLNPPFHHGTAIETDTAAGMMRTAAAHLTPGGRVLTVFNSHLRYRDRLEDLIGPSVQLARTAKFTVVESRLPGE